MEDQTRRLERGGDQGCDWGRGGGGWRGRGRGRAVLGSGYQDVKLAVSSVGEWK